LVFLYTEQFSALYAQNGVCLLYEQDKNMVNTLLHKTDSHFFIIAVMKCLAKHKSWH